MEDQGEVRDFLAECRQRIILHMGAMVWNRVEDSPPYNDYLKIDLMNLAYQTDPCVLLEGRGYPA